MAICEICDREVEDTVVCSQCGVEFCEFCGDTASKVCDMCKQHENDDDSIDDFGDEY
ncbi:MAG: hypothetical protein JW791_05370 [Nanoarchaeota archaeon]|nr:hypothetical protein [Nanoarchaeota archaeon]